MNSQKTQQCPLCKRYFAPGMITWKCPRCIDIEQWLRTPPKNATEKKS
jgi:phage FluMu protein Com